MRFVPLLLLSLPPVALGADWPQFRGPHGRAVAADADGLPDELDLEKTLLWRVPLAKGHSTPVVVRGRVFVTACDGEKLWTIALEADSGREVWRREAPSEKLEKVHRVGSQATPSVACDGERIVAMFGSCGLFCYGFDGTPLWNVPMGPFDNSFGAASSPLIVDNRVVVLQDHDTGSHLVCLDLETGERIWRTERPEAKRGYSSPVAIGSGEKAAIVVAGCGRLTAYDLADGRRTWFVRGLCRVVSNTPVLGVDGRLYVASTGGGAAPNEPPFVKLITDRDANSNGRLEARELPGSPIKSFFGQFDSDKNGGLDEAEYESVRQIFAEAKPSAFAVRTDGAGDVTDSHVDWTQTRSVPRNASPVLVGETLFVVRDGGVLVSLDANDGEPIEQARLPGSGKQFSSPVVGDGKLFVADDRGILSVVTADPEFDVLSSVDLGDGVYASPSIADGRLFVRTTSALFCFAGKR